MGIIICFRGGFIPVKQMGKKLRQTASSGFRQCVYDPKPGRPAYWLSGAEVGANLLQISANHCLISPSLSVLELTAVPLL